MPRLKAYLPSGEVEIFSRSQRLTPLQVVKVSAFGSVCFDAKIRVVPRKDRFVPILGWSFFILIYKENET